MSLLFAMRPVCDLYFYTGVLALFGLLRWLGMDLMLLPLFLGTGAAIGYALRRRGRAARLIPLMLGFAPLLIRFSPVRMLALIPAVVYTGLYVLQNERPPDWYFTYDRFRYSLIPMGFLTVVGLLVNGSPRDAIPSLFLYCTLSVVLLRILRHDENIIRQRRFRVINLLGIAVACAAGLVMASDRALALLKQLMLLLRDYILLPLLNVLLWILRYVAMFIEWVISLIPMNGEPIKLEISDSMTAESVLDPDSMTQMTDGGNPLLSFVLRAAGILLLVALGFLLLRFLSRQAARFSEIPSEDTRETLDEDDGDTPQRGIRGMIARRNDPVLAVRHIYRKYLTLARSRDIPLNGRQNSLQIRDLSRNVFPDGVQDPLRDIYIRARYDADATQADVKAAGEALSRLRKKPE